MRRINHFVFSVAMSLFRTTLDIGCDFLLRRQHPSVAKNSLMKTTAAVEYYRSRLVECKTECKLPTTLLDDVLTGIRGLRRLRNLRLVCQDNLMRFSALAVAASRHPQQHSPGRINTSFRCIDDRRRISLLSEQLRLSKRRSMSPVVHP